VLDPARVFADQEAREVVEHALHRQLAAGDAALADTADAGVGPDLDDELIAMAGLDREALDGGDLHARSPPGERYRGRYGDGQRLCARDVLVAGI
jgi:hypothetical protein